MPANIYDMTDTWNNGGITFSAIKMNVTYTAAANDSALIDLQVGGTSHVRYAHKNPLNNNFPAFTLPTNSLLMAAGNLAWLGYDIGYNVFGLGLYPQGAVRFSVASGFGFGYDTGITRSSAGVLEVNDGGASPGIRRDLYARNLRTEATTVASLTAAATAGAGARSFVTDSSVTTFGTTVAGGGSNAVPVYSDGTNWKVG